MLTTDEIEVLEEALEFYQENGLTKKFQTENLVAFAELLMISDKAEAQYQASIKQHELSGRQKNFKDRLILLRAKLVQLKDKSIVEEL